MKHYAAMLWGVFLQLVSAWFIIKQADPVLGLLFHFLGAGFWGWGGTILMPEKSLHGAGLVAVFAGVLPGMGWVISGGMIFLLRRQTPEDPGRPLLVWRDRKIRNNLVLARSIDGAARVSIAEILRGPDPSRRRNAILAVKDLDVRAALPLLRKGLQDSDEQVRIFAQNSLSGLLEKFEGRIKVLERRAESTPTDVNTAVGLAEQYFELVYLDVAGDEETSDHLLAKAMMILDDAARQAPDNVQIALLQLRYALRQRDPVRAAEALQRARDLAADEQVVLPQEAELAYQRRDWAELRSLLGRFVDGRFVNPRIEALAKFWRVARASE